MDSGKVVNGSEVTTVIRQVLEKAAAHKLEPNFNGDTRNNGISRYL